MSNVNVNVNDIVIIGAGQSGGWAAKTLRDNGFTGSLVLIGEEEHVPYERPPLSKAVLLGELGPAACRLWPAERLTELKIQLELGTQVEAVDRASGRVICKGGRSFPYDQLLLATGSRPRRLLCEGADLAGVHYLRTIDDCMRIREELGPEANLVVLGGGWIGLEVAASLRARGVKVTVIEASGQLCGRSLPQTLGRFLLETHLERGVDVRLNARIARLVGDGTVRGVELDDGTVVDATLVVVGIGAVPNDELARACGLEVGNGIVVDENCRTSDPRIYACGDVADQPIGTVRVRFETWKNAQDQGVAAARSMLGLAPAARELPWFWSDQYDINLQMLGTISAGAQQYRKPNVNGTGFLDLFVQDGQLVAAASVNSPRDLREAKRAMQNGMSVALDGMTRV